MNLHYGDARNKNNSSGQNKLNKFTPNTYASSSINSISTFPTFTSSLNFNMVASDGLKPSVASWSPSPNENTRSSAESYPGMCVGEKIFLFVCIFVFLFVCVCVLWRRT